MVQFDSLLQNNQTATITLITHNIPDIFINNCRYFSHLLSSIKIKQQLVYGSSRTFAFSTASSFLIRKRTSDVEFVFPVSLSVWYNNPERCKAILRNNHHRTPDVVETGHSFVQKVA